ncbi:MAG: 2-amino-4-hydroxy-6-hydroxymethyldihydropteridine diphosphokinase [Dysgonomonas sp.]|jgi:2-amino-4-hydroxy-6-hydroxymethyldihydropteridine diphosphokinase|uniref:2-amino-4-hydroxy-6- hydroxymethyldihydropteridine diphosphokinase n=1 Tax=unclassified Dysgonomonas TaxID=2630389 RepID=UPI0025C081F8|nr:MULTISPECIES: 2-amino-4-hydroxy-6-hydroxymethyldihydropteridine diphosphokinase [unclassified Dysgonomonas]MDR1716682.1 2-amino-4-hydroxy-6-hydroxymethyldihydropteridine diphosphokinase [Prevotella sp.]MDR2002278.1 2-amino-4-hydroxy-6-hydroxymethyldihydropteridine diphosphokinase [Prevotella sp.]HMM04714.1 2-amino-4-hydroxy-6-hydroxymethyldihydropteridine diphosphokinase [Dysgonomonas sp.]
MNKALLSIGTNEDRESNLSLCHQFLDNIFTDISYSDTSVTMPYGTTYRNDFLNQLAVIYTDRDRDEVIRLLKSIEKDMGRNGADKKNGIVKIDIDLVIWNNNVLKPEDFTRSYIADLLASMDK